MCEPLPECQNAQAQKRALRQHFRSHRRSLDPGTRAHEEAAVVDHLRHTEVLSGRVALYKPIDGELDPEPIATAVRAAGGDILFPRCAGQDLLFCPDVHGAWKPGAFGILEPTSAPVPLDTVNTFIVPAVAIDLHGYRLGFGGGYYDRLLQQNPCIIPKCIALVFQIQRCARLPVQAHDIPLAYILDAAGLHTVRIQPTTTPNNDLELEVMT